MKKKTVKTSLIIKSLRKARKCIEVYSMPQHVPAGRQGALFALGLITVILGKEIGLELGTKEYNSYIKRIHGLKGREATTQITKERQQIKKKSEEYISEQQRLAAMPCTCDGGGTICRACIAEREIKRFKAAGIIL